MAKKLVLVPRVTQQQGNQQRDDYSTLKGIAGFPVRALASVAGFPGDILQPMREEGLISNPKEQQNTNIYNNILSNLPGPAGLGIDVLRDFARYAPTSKDISSAVLPEEYAKERSYDLPLQLATTLGWGTGPKIAAIASDLMAGNLGRAGLGALSKLGQTAVRGTGLYAGSKAAETLGGMAGGAVGYPKTGATIGGLLGGFGGLKATEAARNLVGLRPTKAIPEALIKREAELGPIKTEAYNKAYDILDKLPEEHKKVDVPTLEKAINDIADEATIGIEEPEAKRINKLLRKITDRIFDDKISIKDAVKIEKNLNSSIYNKDLPPVLKRSMIEARNLINKEVINPFADKNPEFGKTWKLAQESHREQKLLQKPESQTGVEKLADAIGGYAKRGTSSYTASLIADLLGFPGWAKKLTALTFFEVPRQVKVARNAAKNHPELYKRWIDSIKEAQKGNPEPLVKMIPVWDKLIAKKQRPEKKKVLVLKRRQ